MHVGRGWFAAVGSGVAVVLAALTVPSAGSADLAADSVVVADWEMNDAPGSTVMVDSSGRGHDGAVSDAAALSGLTLDGSAYSWSARCRDCPPTAESRVVQVADSPELEIPDPDIPWSVALRFRTWSGHGNLVQKGQATTAGGQIKVEDPEGLRCVFLGADGRSVVISNPRRLDDGQWHTAECLHTASSVSEWVDGVLVAAESGSTGPITNSMPVTIGGKILCNQDSVGCDYYSGSIDWVHITGGPTGPTTTAAPSATASPTPASTPTPSGSPTPEPTPAVPQRDWARVVHVTSGDTVKVRRHGRTVRVRLVGVDAPRMPRQCGARAATDVLTAKLPSGTRVELVSDVTQPNRDRYGQLLRYLVTGSTDTGLWQLRRGNARLVVTGPRFTHYAEYWRAEHSAKRHQRAIWGSC